MEEYFKISKSRLLELLNCEAWMHKEWYEAPDNLVTEIPRDEFEAF